MRNSVVDIIEWTTRVEVPRDSPLHRHVVGALSAQKRVHVMPLLENSTTEAGGRLDISDVRITEKS